MKAREIWWQEIEPALAPALRERAREAQAHHLVVLFRQLTGAEVVLE